MTKINVDDLKGSLEPRVYKNLRALQRKHSLDIEYEPDSLEYVISHWYTPDFKITRKDGTTFYIEAKGYWRPDDRSKLLHIKKQHPEVDIRMVFDNNPKLHKKSNIRYSDWCEKRNIPYSIGVIPEEWLEAT